MEYITSLPFGLAVSALFVIVMLRANATYWTGRGIAAGGRRTRLERKLDSPGMRRAEAIIARWGAPAVSLCFLTVGIQTAINATAGIGRMPLRRYLPAVIVGSVLWAVLYATVGLAVLNAWLAAAAGSPAGIAVVVVLAAAIVTAVVISRRRRGAARGRRAVDSDSAGAELARAGGSSPGNEHDAG
ncbi:DedA family protein [Arthrobacter castelli]|uniref:DedA family protein n=1 Tax=Arthrobacter castelli TaxID=271431 RepID=UPI0003FDA14C|nr:VTT domain-containing protein [Arthrobacter castelli]